MNIKDLQPKQGKVEIKGTLKSTLFLQMIAKSNSEDNLFLLKEIKNENIIVYPNSMFFRSLNYIPNFALTIAGYVKR